MSIFNQNETLQRYIYNDIMGSNHSNSSQWFLRYDSNRRVCKRIGI